MNERSLTDAEHDVLEARCLDSLAREGHDITDLIPRRWAPATAESVEPEPTGERIDQPTLC